MVAWGHFLSILRGFGVPVWSHFGSIGGHFCPSGGSEPKNGGLFGESVARFVFLTIFGQILGCLGQEKQAFGV